MKWLCVDEVNQIYACNEPARDTEQFHIVGEKRPARVHHRLIGQVMPHDGAWLWYALTFATTEMSRGTADTLEAAQEAAEAELKRIENE